MIEANEDEKPRFEDWAETYIDAVLHERIAHLQAVWEHLAKDSIQGEREWERFLKWVAGPISEAIVAMALEEVWNLQVAPDRRVRRLAYHRARNLFPKNRGSQ
ncbi:MAG: hypothetical protein AB7N24_17320 [Dehalococcoidia bacterium]